ncbi:MAG: invasin domain 3-containing protein [Bacteroidota bacterium]|nr:invasin domain 3-containing protein [Bacteroidota bacterium]
MTKRIKKYVITVFLILFCVSGTYSQDRFFTYYNSWCMGTDGQWNMGSAFYISTKTYAQHIGNTTHVIIFMVNDIVRGDFEPYLSITQEYINNGGSTKDSLNFWYNGFNNPGSGATAWQSRGTIFHLRDSLHAKGRKILMCMQAVGATAGLNAIMSDSLKTEKFTTATANWVYRHNFDGVDLNTESGITFDSIQAGRFFRILRQKLPNKLITIVPVLTHTARYSLSKSYIDFVLPQMYAYALNWQPAPVCNPAGQNGVFLNAPLHKDPSPPASNHQDITTWGPNLWYNAGWSKDKVVMLLSTEANPFKNIDTMYSCIGGGKPFWPDTAAYRMLDFGGKYYWDSVHIGAYIAGTATKSLTSRGYTLDSAKKFYIPVLAKQNIDSVVAWGKKNGFNNYGLFDVSTDARTPTANKTPLHAHLGSLLNISFSASNASALKSVVTANPLSIPADSNSTATITVQVKDTGGVNLSKGGEAVILGTTLGTISSTTDNGNGTYSATLRSSKTPGKAVVGGTLNGVLIGDTASVIFSAVGSVVNKDGSNIPNEYELRQNYPNPFNPSTKVAFGIPENSQVIMKLYDITGREVATIVNNYFEAGRYTVTIDASSLASGVYLYRLDAGNFVDTKKLLLLR